MKRWIDKAVTKFNVSMWGTTIGIFALIGFWVWRTEERGFPYLNTAFVVTWLITIAMIIPVLVYAKRRPTDQEPTWGEAMLGATYIFALMFWIYGVVPHQFLTFADNELGWRSDKGLIGPRFGFLDDQGILEWALPFDLNYRVVRDLIAVHIYVFGLAANMALFSIWQKRGDALPSTDVEKASRYGRPIVRRETAETVGV